MWGSPLWLPGAGGCDRVPPQVSNGNRTRATAGTYPSCQRCCAASAPHSGKTKGEGPCKHESSGKMRKVEVIGDNLYLSHFPGYCVAGKESSTRIKDTENGRIARFCRSKRAEVGLCRQKKTAGATPAPEDAGYARMRDAAERNS